VSKSFAAGHLSLSHKTEQKKSCKARHRPIIYGYSLDGAAALLTQSGLKHVGCDSDADADLFMKVACYNDS